MANDEFEPRVAPVIPIRDRGQIEYARFIIGALKDMTDDELELTYMLVKKMIDGSRKYGGIILDSDPREFLEEWLSEELDKSHYINMKLLQLLRNGGR